jgi:hypothetical protein
MPNPNRPQYQDTVEETWGQAVADTVVRRYANTADRDADLAGFTPAELAGQLVTIAPGGGVLPWLASHDGNAWQDIAPTPKFGNPFVGAAPPGPARLYVTTNAIPTNASGDGDFDMSWFGLRYGYAVAGLSNVDATAGQIILSLNHAACSLVTLSLKAWYHDGSPVQGSPLVAVALLGG